MRLFGAVLAALVLATPLASSSQTRTDSRRLLAIYTTNGRDARVDAARQAVAFWNRTLSELGAAPAFLEPHVVVSARLTRALQTYATKISKDGWKDDREHLPGTPALAPPDEIAGLPGDVIVLLATQPILSFAWPIGGGRYFVTIRTDRVPPLDKDGARRNVVAHELGHTLGLTHNGSHTLMCASCDMTPDSERTAYLPLTPADLARLALLKETASSREGSERANRIP